MAIRSRFIVAVALLLTASFSQAFPWSKDMRDQPAVKPQKAEVRGTPDSVPASGTDEFPAPRSLAEIVETRVVLAAGLKNPVAGDDESIAAGKVAYELHCQVCHGASGKGDGPVGKKYLPTPMDLGKDYVQLQEDGSIYYTITHGGVYMPFYRDAIKKQDRWNIVNYIKNGLVEK